MTILAILFAGLLPASPAAATPVSGPLEGVKRVVFLGDSITHAGHYIEYVEAYTRLKNPGQTCEFLDLGLPSETVSGLSEPGHAGGAFPRPDLAERLDRVLAQTRPGLVVACYGMNDGIYYPFGDERARSFQAGMTHLRERSIASGAKVLHLTPPVFDPAPIRASTLPAGLPEYRQPFEGYDDVLTRYSDWLLARKGDGWDVVDIHGPMKKLLDEGRARDPSFALARDGVHINREGHWAMARAILIHWGFPADELKGVSGDEVLASRPHGAGVLALVRRKQEVLKDAWLSATGHKRPGMKQGLAVEGAEAKARELDQEIGKLLARKP